MIVIDIAKNYTRTPGGRYISDGEYSGEDFRERILYPNYLRAVEMKEKIQVNFDGCYGFPSCFLEEAFGGLVRKVDEKASKIIKRFKFISVDDSYVIKQIKGFMKQAK